MKQSIRGWLAGVALCGALTLTGCGGSNKALEPKAQGTSDPRIKISGNQGATGAPGGNAGQPAHPGRGGKAATTVSPN